MKRTRIFTVLLAIALIATMAVAYATQALAFSVPTVTVANLDDLLLAIDAAEDGDSIGIDGLIEVYSDVVLGDAGKHITLVKISPTSSIGINYVPTESKVQNLTFEGAGIEANYPFLQISGNVNVENCIFEHNKVVSGAGAVVIFDGSVNFKNCLFDDNQGTQGGHIAISTMQNVLFEGCTLKNGSASLGGGAIVNSAYCKIKDSVLSDNNGTTVGGAIRNSGVLTIENTKFNDNTAEIGSDIATGTSNPITFIDSAAELNALYAADGVTAEWVKETVSSPEYGDYISWELVLTAIPEEPTEPEQPEEPVTPTEPSTPTVTPSEPNNTNNSVESNPSTRITVEEPLGNVENHITVTTPSEDAAQAYINGYIAGNGQGGTSTPIEQTIKVEAAQAPTENASDPNTLNINITVGSDLQETSQTEAVQMGLSWYHIAVLCLLFGILCSLIMLAVFFSKKA